MPTDLEILVTAPWVKTDDESGGTRRIGRPLGPTDSESVCLAVAQALLGFRSEARWPRFAHTHPRAMFFHLPRRPGYNKRRRAALPLVMRALRASAIDTAFWSDTVWITDSTPWGATAPIRR